MTIEVSAYSPAWPDQFALAAGRLAEALQDVPLVAIEHVGSTAVPGLPAKPILDIDVIVGRAAVRAATTRLEAAGYVHRGDLGLTDREAFDAPDDDPPRHVYVCVEGTLHVRNHLAVRDALRRDAALRDRYGAVKLALAAEDGMTLARYVAGKSAVLQEVLAGSGLTAAEKALVLRLNAAP